MRGATSTSGRMIDGDEHPGARGGTGPEPAPAGRDPSSGKSGLPGSLPALPIAGLALIALALAGCANARVSNVASAPPTGPAPVEVLVAVSAVPASGEDAAQTRTAQQVAGKLQSDLIQRLTEAHVTAEPFVPGTSHPGAAVLHVAIAKAGPGNAVERFVIGFGAGRAELQATADLLSTDGAGATSMTAFSTSGNSGYKPGLILPGGVAFATRDVVHLAIGGGIKVATSVNDGIDKPVETTATAVVGQLKKYYASAGWYWPAG